MKKTNFKFSFFSSSNNQDTIFGQEHSSLFAKLNPGLFSNLATLNQINSTKSMASSMFASPEQQEETIKNMLKFNNYHNLPFNGSAFNLVKKDYHKDQQLHNSMMSDEAFTDLSDNSPADEEFMSDEQMSEDEQPLDFSIKSKKEDLNEQQLKRENSLYLANRLSMDQVDGDLMRLSNLNNLNNNSQLHSTMLNSFHADSALQYYAHQLNNNSKFNSVSSANLMNSRHPFMNHFLLGESQTSSIHSEPSSPEALSSASSTSSRSSQGYYSGSSLSGGGSGNFSLPSALSNQSIAPTIYSPNLFNQTTSSPLNKSYLQAPPPYASLNFTNSSSSSSKPTHTRNSVNNQQIRPSVIVSNSKNRSSTLTSSKNKEIESDLHRSKFGSNATDKIDKVDKIDNSIEEHFRLSLGASYNKITNSQSTPTKKEAFDCFSKKQQTPSSKFFCAIDFNFLINF